MKNGAVGLPQHRVVAAVLLVGLLGTAAPAWGGGDAAQAQSAVPVVRIVARKLASGGVEFGLQRRLSDDSWGSRQLPAGRFFPTDAPVDRWLRSSAVEIAAGRVRIIARRLENGKIEFGLQEAMQASSSWAGRRLPSSRFFPSDATIGRWLASSPLELLLATSGSPIRIIGVYLVQNVVGDSRGAAARYELSTTCGDRFDEPYEVELREGRFNITEVFASGKYVDGVPLAATTARGEACVVSAAIWDLPSNCSADSSTKSANLAHSDEYEILEFTITCGGPTSGPSPSLDCDDYEELLAAAEYAQNSSRWAAALAGQARADAAWAADAVSRDYERRGVYDSSDREFEARRAAEPYLRLAESYEQEAARWAQLAQEHNSAATRLRCS